MDDILVHLGMALPVEHIPAERLKERVEELAPELRLVIPAGAVGFSMFVKALYKLVNDLRSSHVCLSLCLIVQENN
ncbi:MAG TPA: hypothetical protein PKL78_05355 [Anaerolineales bacterium]|nr:hypothetical protein [Anaerolineales bacterium]